MAAVAEKENRAESQAKSQLDSIREMVRALDTEDDDEREKAQEAIQEDALEVSVRSDWTPPGEKAEAGEYRVLLCTGGPAVRLIGNLGQWSEPETARLEHQDWFTPWSEYPLDEDEEKDCITYAQQFYFGE